MISRAAAAAALHKQSLKCPGRAVASVVETPLVVTLSILMHLRTVSEANAHGHWRERQRRAKAQRMVVAAFLPPKLPPLPARILITRIGKRKLDSDNLASSQKHVRDEIAAAYRVDDGSDLYDWVYSQEIGKEYAVRIEITSMERTAT